MRHRPTQVVLALCSLSLERSVSQVSPQVLSLLVLHPRIPDDPPEMLSFMCRSFVGALRACWSFTGGLGNFVCGSPVSTSHRGSILGRNLSGRRAFLTAPCRFTYCESLRWWVGSLQVSITLWRCVLSFSRSSVSPSLPGLPQLEPQALTVVSPFQHPTVFPIQREAISILLTRLFSGS